MWGEQGARTSDEYRWCPWFVKEAVIHKNEIREIASDMRQTDY